MRHAASLLVLILCDLLLPNPRAVANVSTPDRSIRDQNTPREFPEITSKDQWQERAREIREQILVSSGLWPLPEKTPLHPVIFGKFTHVDYSVERVYFQTYPGFYLAGNLYRPVGKENGPFPAILNPHGHWERGRLNDTETGSIPGRCINFARQGMIAFSYDMVGYNDTHFPESPTNTSFYNIHRDFATNDAANLLWNISLMGLQTWNSIRALDFIASLPDADPHRLACTGASGGGTQTFILGAVDDRLAAQAPVVMVSHTMQGGCGCENMPGLRIEFSNVEIAAAAAPRPQILVGASGDWTKTMATVEGPAIHHIYDLFSVPERLRYVLFDFPHNYNQTSREAVYQWFDKWLLGKADEPVKEPAFKKDPDADLRVFPDGKIPADALSQRDLIKSLKKMHQAQLESMQPTDLNTLQKYKDIMRPAWRRTLHLDLPRQVKEDIQQQEVPADADYSVEEHAFSYHGEDAGLKVRFFKRRGRHSPEHVLVLLVDARGSAAFCDDAGAPKGLARRLLDKHFKVGMVEEFPKMEPRDETSIMFNTYNRTWLQTQVRNIAAVCQSEAVVLCGTGRAGLWCLLAAPEAGAVIADCDQLDVSKDENFLAPDLFCPGLRNIDTFTGALALHAPLQLMLHNVAGSFPIAKLRRAYKAMNALDHFRSDRQRLTDDQIVAWISKVE